MLDFYHQLAHLLRQEPIVLATVIQVNGSAPREVGAMMMVRANGEIIGTIGGGAGEALVIQHAQQVLATGEKQQVEIDLSGSPQRHSQGVCGGTVTLWLERWQGNTMQTLATEIVALLSANQTATLTIPLSQHHHPHLNITPAHALHPTPHTLYPTPHASHPTFTTLLHPPPTLLIVGAGHCAVPLAQMAHLVGFQVVVQDDRPEFATSERFPTATKVLTLPIAESLATLAPISQLYVALVTRGYTWDLEALKVLLPRSTCYIGMIGSQKRIKTVFQALIQEGISGMESLAEMDLQRTIHAPIGLDIGAQTPEEIAVSICAELIKVRNGGTGHSLATQTHQRLLEKTSRLDPPKSPLRSGTSIQVGSVPPLKMGVSGDQCDLYVHGSSQHYGIILAAGSSTRMGICKASLPWRDGKTLLSYQVEQFWLAGISAIVVLAPHNRDRCLNELPPSLVSNCIIAVNPHPESGKTSSILTGLAALPPALTSTVESLMISAVDQPRPAWIYQTLLQAHSTASNALITAPIHHQRIGHPVVFSQRLLPNLTMIREETLGLRQILQEFSDFMQTVDLSTDEIFIDLNTPEAYHTEFSAKPNTP